MMSATPPTCQHTQLSLNAIGITAAISPPGYSSGDYLLLKRGGYTAKV